MITVEDLATELKEIKGMLQTVLNDRSKIANASLLPYVPNKVDALRMIIDRDGVEAAEKYLKQQYKKERLLRGQRTSKAKAKRTTI
jgi:hypothetical protein